MIVGDIKAFGKAVEYHPPKRMEYIPGKMILRLKESAVQPHVGAASLRFTAARAKELPEHLASPLEYLRKSVGLKHLEPIFSTRSMQLRRSGLSATAKGGLAVLSSVKDSTNEDLRGIAVADVDPKKVTAAVMKKLEASPAIEYVERMPARWAATNLPAHVDPMQNLQWGLRTIGWFNAKFPATEGVLVGVMDTGIDQGHPDLKAAIHQYHHNGTSAHDIIGHGTHVSGIISAIVNNAVGISGVSACKLIMWKIFGDEPADDGNYYVDGDAFLRALGEARSSGVRAINLSIGGTQSSLTERILFRRLIDAGVTVLAAMGNEFQQGNPKEYPGAYPGVFAVAAVAENLKRSIFSNTGKHAGICAPGSNILSTLPRKKSVAHDETEYASWSGTSMATPHVAAAAALVAAKNPGWGPSDIKKHLAATATTLADMKNKSWTPAYGAGLLNLSKAL